MYWEAKERVLQEISLRYLYLKDNGDMSGDKTRVVGDRKFFFDCSSK